MVTVIYTVTDLFVKKINNIFDSARHNRRTYIFFNSFRTFAKKMRVFIK